MTCNQVQPRLSDFIDDSLSARDTWEVDRHIAECHECTRLLNELRRTVDLLNAAPVREVSDDFMARLQARIERTEPAPARGAWLDGLRQLFRPRLLPAWGAALATCTLIALLASPRFNGSVRPSADKPVIETASVQRAAGQNVILSASDPFADLGSANLIAHASSQQSSEADTLN